MASDEIQLLKIGNFRQENSLITEMTTTMINTKCKLNKNGKEKK